MSNETAVQSSRLIKRDGVLPPTIETVIRRLLLDKYTGNVQLNIVDGKIVRWNEQKFGTIPPNEI